MNEKVILLIEDDPDDQALTIKAMRKHAVVVARDGQEAFDFLYGEGDFKGRDMSLPILIVLDLKLPKVNGFDVLRRIKTDQKTKSIPVIVCSSSSDESDIWESYSLGANSYVVKPVEYSQYLEKVKSITAYWLGVNMLPTLIANYF